MAGRTHHYVSLLSTTNARGWALVMIGASTPELAGKVFNVMRGYNLAAGGNYYIDAVIGQFRQ